MDPLFPQKTLFGTDSKPFKYPLNELYDPVFLVDIVKSSETLKIEEQFRVDKAVKELEHSSKYIKTVNIINGKDKGIFSYNVDDDIYAPDPSAIGDTNSEYDNLSPFNKTIELESNVSESFINSARTISSKIDMNSKNILVLYIENSKINIVVSSYEQDINKKIPNLI